MDNGFVYYRKCPTCGHLEAVNEQPKPIPEQPIQRQKPVTINSSDQISGVPPSGWKDK